MSPPPPPDLTERSHGDVVILDLRRLAGRDGTEAFQNRINGLLTQGRRKFLLNLSDLVYADSAGLSVLIRAYTTVTRQNGVIKVAGLTKRIAGDLLSLTKIMTVFATYDDEAEALWSFENTGE